MSFLNPPRATPTTPTTLPNHPHPSKQSLRNLERGSEEYEAVRKEVNLRAAQRLLHVCSMHGGVYTKFGQHIASMNHVLPKEFTDTLKVLQDRNPRLEGREGGRKEGGKEGLRDVLALRVFVVYPRLGGRNGGRKEGRKDQRVDVLFWLCARRAVCMRYRFACSLQVLSLV